MFLYYLRKSTQVRSKKMPNEITKKDTDYGVFLFPPKENMFDLSMLGIRGVAVL